MLIGEVVAAASESWMLVGVAGAFTILGVIISGLGTWLNEIHKAKRDKTRANESELVNAGAAMLTVSENFRRTGAERLTRTQDEFATHVTKVAGELTSSLQTATSRM
jgi:UDP-N-acetylglucosamine:LPS N-acetylglucosamine transferase